ncbi:MAG: LysM peptidoglycan-binding domain-containing protein [Paludibacteraceae bacterium]|nr:LysM peptidoglycan-binding domain-containing protein [Paludibacteraceae bacterium]
MKTLLFALYIVTLPWSQLFREEMALNEDIIWSAVDISGLDMEYKEGTRAGIWGLTPAVARSYGLRVDKWVDERYDVKRSSQAAAYYMKDLIRKYNNDTTRALLAFVNTPFRQVGDERWVTPGRTPRDVPSHLLSELYDAYEITDNERACRIAEADSIRRSQMEQQKTLVAQQQAIQQEARQQAVEQKEQQKTVHVVRKGETLSHIASKYRCTVNQLKQWNNLKSDLLQIGQKLKIKK